MTLLIDNHDSFTYNVYQSLRQLGEQVEVILNDEQSVDEILELKFDFLVISPGPGSPEEAGICLDLLRRIPPRLPILGICLGHQILAHHFGGKVIQSSQIKHGKIEKINHFGGEYFKNVPRTFKATRYHSLVVEVEGAPELISLAQTESGKNMAISHVQRPVLGLQFHPESYGSECGQQIFANFFESHRVNGFPVELLC